MFWVLFFPAALLNSGFASCWIAWVFTMKWGCRIVESSNCRVMGSNLRDLNDRPDSEEPLVAADGEWFPLFQACWSWRIHKLCGFDLFNFISWKFAPFVVSDVYFFWRQKSFTFHCAAFVCFNATDCLARFFHVHQPVRWEKKNTIAANFHQLENP